MKIAAANPDRTAPGGFLARVMKFKDLLNGLPRLSLVFGQEDRPDGHFSVPGAAVLAKSPVRVEEAGAPDPVKSAQLQAGAEELAVRIGEAARQVVSPDKVVVSFNSGWLSGVTCVVDVQGHRVRCRFRSEGAVARKLLGGTRKAVAGRLRCGGFELEDYEVGS